MSKQSIAEFVLSTKSKSRVCDGVHTECGHTGEFAEFRQNLNLAKMTPHWSARRRSNDSGLRATSLPYHLLRAETISCTRPQDKLILPRD